MSVNIIGDFKFGYILLIYSNPKYIMLLDFTYMYVCRLCFFWLVWNLPLQCSYACGLFVVVIWWDFDMCVHKIVLCSNGCFSVTKRQIVLYSSIYIASQHFMCLPYLHSSNICMVSSWGSYTCLLFQMSKA